LSEREREEDVLKRNRGRRWRSKRGKGEFFLSFSRKKAFFPKLLSSPRSLPPAQNKLTSASAGYPLARVYLDSTSLRVCSIISRPKAVTEAEISRQGITPTVAPVKP
jgi:hypothetical protein